MNKGSISYEFAKDHVEKWVKGWNDHNLNAIMSSYAEELEFSSPKIRMMLGENRNNTIHSKRELNTYFSAGLERFPNLKFKIIGFTVSDNNVILEYSANLDGKSIVNVIEKFEFQNELVIKSAAFITGLNKQHIDPMWSDNSGTSLNTITLALEKPLHRTQEY